MQPRKNSLIEAMSPDLQKQFLSSAKGVELPQATDLFSAGEEIGSAWFLTSGLASMVVSTADGSSAEVGMIGTEGIVGGYGVLGPGVAVSRCVMQLNGSALRMPMAEARKLFQESTEFRNLVLEYVQADALLLTQIAGCNKIHQATERLARWLLTASDRTGQDTLGLTQESLSQMLGTRRTTVALVAGDLQRKKLLQYRRGVIKIVDRPRLEAAACDCYGVTRRLVDGLYQRRPV